MEWGESRGPGGDHLGWEGLGGQSHPFPSSLPGLSVPSFLPAWVLWSISGGMEAPHLGEGCWDDGELCRDEGLESPPTPGMGGWQQQPSTAGIQAAISIATGIPSQGIDLLKAQCRSQPTAARRRVRIVGSVPPCDSPPSFLPQFVLGGQAGQPGTLRG